MRFVYFMAFAYDGLFYNAEVSLNRRIRNEEDIKYAHEELKKKINHWSNAIRIINFKLLRVEEEQ